MLNKANVKNKYLLIYIDDLFYQMHEVTIFSKIILRGRYHQLRVKEENISKIVFITRYGHYEFIVLPFGLDNALSNFTNIMNNVFKYLLDKCILIFLDYILIYSRNGEKHRYHLRFVL